MTGGVATDCGREIVLTDEELRIINIRWTGIEGYIRLSGVANDL